MPSSRRMSMTRGRRAEQVLAPDDVGDPQVRVVDGVGQQEARGVVAPPPDHEVLDVGVVEGDVAPDEVPDLRRALGHADGHAEAGLQGRARHLVLVVVDQVGGTVGQQLLAGGAVEVPPVGLVDRALVPVDAQPLEGLENGADQLRPAALLVGVLDAQDQRARLVAGEEPVEQRRAGPTHVQVARGCGREADAGTGCHPPRVPAPSRPLPVATRASPRRRWVGGSGRS